MPSLLSALNRKVNWFISHRLHTVQTSSIPENLLTSQLTIELIRKHNTIVEQLKRSIKLDYELQKNLILQERARLEAKQTVLDAYK